MQVHHEEEESQKDKDDEEVAVEDHLSSSQNEDQDKKQPQQDDQQQDQQLQTNHHQNHHREEEDQEQEESSSKKNMAPRLVDGKEVAEEESSSSSRRGDDVVVNVKPMTMKTQKANHNNDVLRHDEQVNEDYYDERDDANDDMVKGKIKFSKKKLYGRSNELNQLHSIYNRMMVMPNNNHQGQDDDGDDEDDSKKEPPQQQDQPQQQTAAPATTTTTTTINKFMSRASRATSMGFTIEDFEDVCNTSFVDSSSCGDDDDYEIDSNDDIDGCSDDCHGAFPSDEDTSEEEEVDGVVANEEQAPPTLPESPTTTNTGRRRQRTKNRSRSRRHRRRHHKNNHMLPGTKQVVFLNGFSGSGKSSLIEEFILQLQTGNTSSKNKKTTKVVQPRFLSGKFDELYTSSAYSAIADAVTKYISTLLQTNNTNNICRDGSGDDGKSSGGIITTTTNTTNNNGEIHSSSCHATTTAAANVMKPNKTVTCDDERSTIQVLLNEALGSYGVVLSDIIPNLSQIMDNPHHKHHHHRSNSIDETTTAATKPLARSASAASLSNNSNSHPQGGNDETTSTAKPIKRSASAVSFTDTTSAAAESMTHEKKAKLVKHVFRTLLSSLCCDPDHPLILFLDDLQWIDERSMELISALLSDVNITYFMLIGAYRSNEVNEDHHVSALIKDLLSKGADEAKGSIQALQRRSRSVECIHLQELTLDDISEFIADSLGFGSTSDDEEEDDSVNDEANDRWDAYYVTLSGEEAEGNAMSGRHIPDEVRALSDAIYQTTLGNIFFTMQAMEELVRHNALYYDVMFFKWEWNLAKIEREKILSHNVVEMVQSKIRQLPKFVQRVLTVAAYTRSNVDVMTLHEILLATHAYDMVRSMGRGKLDSMILGLHMAAEEGLLVLSQSPASSSTVTAAAASRDTDDSLDTMELKFSHDRIQEAAQGLVEGGELDTLCYQIASELEHRSHTSHGDDWMLFTAVYHLNSLPSGYVSSNSGSPLYMTNLNLRAAKAAIARSSFTQAVEFLRLGARNFESHFPDKKRKWEENYDFCLDLYNNLIETELHTGNVVAAQTAVDEVIACARSHEDKFTAQFQCIELSTSNKERDFKQAVELSVSVLACHGIKLPLKPTRFQILKAQWKLKLVQRGRNLMDLLDGPTMDDYHEKIMKLLLQLQSSALVAGNGNLNILTILLAQRLSWEQGVSTQLPGLLANYGAQLRRAGKIRQACECSADAEELLRRLCASNGPTWVQGTFLCRGPVVNMRFSYASSLEVFSEVHRVGISCGEIQWAILSAMLYSLSYFAAGAPLNALFVAKLLLFEQEAKSFGISPSLMVTFRLFRQTVLNLQRTMVNPTLLRGKAVDQEKTLVEFEGDVQKQTLRDFTLFRLMLACVFGDEKTIVDMIDLLSTYPLFDLPVARQHLRDTFMGLGALYVARRERNRNETPKRFHKLARKKYSIFQKLARIGSENAPPVMLCLRAEQSPSKSKYDKAIESCLSCGMIHLAALMNEWCGLFHFEASDKAEVAKSYIAEAMWLYYDWGAAGKVDQMKQTYPFLQTISRKYDKTARTSATRESAQLAMDVVTGESPRKSNS